MLLYVHIPFCLHKCPYCDFNTYAVTRVPESDYLQALLAELDFRGSRDPWRGAPIETIFFGGGTPSLLRPETVAVLIARAREILGPSRDLEITLEANPGSVTADSLCGFRDAGVNRISFGAQSFSDELLTTLGRIHRSEEIGLAVEHARQAGFANINLDLMYGIPGQTAAQIEQDLEHVLDLEVQHVSAYCLTFEKGTPFFAAREKGKLLPPPDEQVLEMMRCVTGTLTARGFRHYEISNFSLPGFEARHNLGYWLGKNYLGLGAGAHSFFGQRSVHQPSQGQRWANMARPEEYSAAARAHGHAEAWSESLDRADLLFERFFLGLRLTDGVNLLEEEHRFGVPLTNGVFSDTLDPLKDRGFITLERSVLALTERGRELADSVIAEFIEPCRQLTQS